MKICLIEPFHAGSHATWAEEYVRYSGHDVTLLTLDGRHWKWRMHGGAVSLAKRFMTEGLEPDLLLASDMLDLATFLALTRATTANLPTALYCHENQLTYPWSPDDKDPQHKRDAHYAFINYTSALAADAILFNSRYHLEALIGQLPEFLQSFPDHNGLENVELIRRKCQVLPLGLDLQALDRYRPVQAVETTSPPLILWNHRWEYDKNPEEFFRALFHLHGEGLAFRVAVLGEAYRKSPNIFDEARQQLGERVIQFGYVESFADYARWLWQADILPVTSHHDFFGASVVQAIYCNCLPLLPRRLAYPEHLPATIQEHYLYDGHDHLVNRLREIITYPSKISTELRSHVARYDWQEQAPQYDALFEDIKKALFAFCVDK